MAGFDELIERLLYDVALSGSEGFDAKRFENAVRAFYEEKNKINVHGDVEPPPNPLFADAPPVDKTVVDDKLLTSILDWLYRHPEVELRRVSSNHTQTTKETATSPVALQLAGKRICTTEDRIWQAIAGHGPDLRRIPQLEFDILSIVAAHSSTGVLQPDITRKTGQDKRSVPKRTDRLQEKGYISKETVIGNNGKTSLLKLKRFSNIQGLEKPPEEAALTTRKRIVHYDRMYNTMMQMLQENDGTVAIADLRIGLGIESGASGKWETKILTRCIRRLEEGGCVRRVTANIVDVEGNAIDTIGHQNWRQAKAVQLMRPPTQYDRLLWEQSDPHMKTTINDEEDEQENTIAAIDAASGTDDDEDDDLMMIGAVEEVGTTQQFEAARKKNANVTVSGGDGDDLNDLDRLVCRMPPQWDPNVPLVNLVFNKVDEAGEIGISTNQLQASIVGPLWKRPMDELLSHLTDIWQYSQPPHLRHLTIVRDTAVFGRSAQFKYRTLPNFEKAVAAGKAVWSAVLDNTSSKAKKDPFQEKPDLDGWGFPKVSLKLLAGRDGRATLADGRKGCQVERMMDLDTERDDVVADDEDETAGTARPRRSTTEHSGKILQRKEERSTQYESTAIVSRTRSPRSIKGVGVNGKKMGSPPKERSEAREQVQEPVHPLGSRSPAATSFGTAQESLCRTPLLRRSSAVRRASTQHGAASTERAASVSAERPAVRGTYLHSKAYTLKHPEVDWVHRGQGRYSRASELPESAAHNSVSVAHSGSGTPSKQRSFTSQEHIPRHRPREVRGKEVLEYERFATKTAENCVGLGFDASRKRGADQAGLTHNNAKAKKSRVEVGGKINTLTVDGVVSSAAKLIPVDQLSSAWIEAAKEENFGRRQPGLYINPPGAKEMKAASFPARGRPRKAKIAVFKSERLHDFDWYQDELQPRFAVPKPLGRKRTAIYGHSLDIPDETVDHSGSDDLEVRRVGRRQNISAEVVGVSMSDHEMAGRVSNSRKMSSPVIEDSERESMGPVRDCQRPADEFETHMNETSASNSKAHGFSTDAPTFETGALGGGGCAAVENGTTVYKEPSELPSSTTLALQQADTLASSIDPLADQHILPIPQENGADAQSKDIAADNAAFYLARYKTEERNTAQQQYTRLSAKPGRKSKRDLEILAILERLIGPQPRVRMVNHKLQPTEIPNRSSIAEAREQLQASLDRGRRLDGAAAASLAPVNTAQSVASGDGDPTDGSRTDYKDRATPQLAAITHKSTVKTASSSNSLTRQQTMQQAVVSQPVGSARRAPTRSAISDESFSSAYVDTHPDETFYHAGGGRWRRGKPPAGHYTKTWRGPGAPDRSAFLAQVQSLATQHMNPDRTSPQAHVETHGAQESSFSKGLIPAQTILMPFSSPSRTHPSPLHVARPYMTTPTSQKSPLMIFRPYEARNASSEKRLQESVGAAKSPAEPTADDILIDNDATHPFHEHDDQRIGTHRSEDEMDTNELEQAATTMTELGVVRALKPVTTQKKTGGVKFGGSTQVQRHDVILSAVRKCGGVFPGDQEMWYVLATAWKKLYDRLPDRHTVEQAVEQLMSEKKLKMFQFKFKSKRSATITKQILAEPFISGGDEMVTQLRKQMMKSYPLQHLPSEVDIDDEFRQAATTNKRRRSTKNGTVTLADPRPAELPEDPVLIVKQTAMAAAKADEDAQKKGFPNAQALREHMQELNMQAKVKSWQKRTDMQRKERRAIASEEALIAADLAIEEAEILGVDASDGQKREHRVIDLESENVFRPASDANYLVSDQVETLNAKGKRRRRRRDRETGELLPLAPLSQSLPKRTLGSQALQIPNTPTLEAAVSATQATYDEVANGAAVEPREPAAGASTTKEAQFEFEAYVPPSRPSRPARKPLGSTRGPVIIREKQFECNECGKWFSRRDNLTQHQRTHGPAKRWYEHEKRLRAATVAHLFSPAQTFTSSNGTFGTSGLGITQHMMHIRATPGTLTLEQYQAETARNLARIKRYAQEQAIEEAMRQDELVGAQKGSIWSTQEDATMVRLKEIEGLSWRDIVAQLPGRTENSARFRYSTMIKNSRYVAPPSIVVSFKVPKEKLDAIISMPPEPVPTKRAKDDDASVFEAAGTPNDLDMSPDPETEPPKKRRRYVSRKKKQALDDEDMDESDDDFVPGAALEFMDERTNGRMPKLKGPGARGIKKPFTTRDRQAHASFKDVDRLVIAIALVSAIAGGLSQDKMSWTLIAHALSYRYEGEFLRRRWDHYRASRKVDVDRIRDAIRQPFLEAYEKDELPVVNLQASHETDWPALYDWAVAKIPMKMSVTVDEMPDAPDLPASKALLEEKFTVNAQETIYQLNKDEYFTTITDQNRRHLAQRVTLGNPLPGEVKPCEVMNNELLLAKSWVRAVAMTKHQKYVPEVAAKKISVLGNKALKKVSVDMVETKMFLQDKRGRQLPGRNFQIHHEVLVQFRRWPASKEIDEHRYLCALAQSWVGINDYFKQTDELLLTPITSDQDYTILTNLVANGMATIRPVLPEVKWEFDAPLPRLSPWGYSGNSYQTKKADPEQLKYDLVYTKTEDYKYDHELNTDVPIPLVPATIEGEPGPRIPFWVDIHGNLIDDIWDMSLRSILHLLVFRSGIRALTMEMAHNHKLWQWEIEMVLDWMEKAGLAVRCGEGEEVNGIWKGGWTASKWWFCAFLPEMIKWEPPMLGGFVEV